jgi:hypothetical protein
MKARIATVLAASVALALLALPAALAGSPSCCTSQDECIAAAPYGCLCGCNNASNRRLLDLEPQQPIDADVWRAAGLVVDSVQAPCPDDASAMCDADVQQATDALAGTLATVTIRNVSAEQPSSAIDAMQGQRLSVWLAPRASQLLAEHSVAAQPAVSALGFCPVDNDNLITLEAVIESVTSLVDGAAAAPSLVGAVLTGRLAHHHDLRARGMPAQLSILVGRA